MSTGHAHADGHGEGSKRIGLLIAVLALILAFSETLGKSAQTSALGHNIEASNFWSFFQAKTIRMTTLRTAAEQAELDLKGLAADGAAAAAREKRINAWKKTAERYDSEPETGEGRQELAARAKASEAKRDRALAAYHHYETASAAVQIAIVLASASIITGVSLLIWMCGALGIVGIAFCAIGFWWPSAVHLF